MTRIVTKQSRGPFNKKFLLHKLTRALIWLSLSFRTSFFPALKHSIVTSLLLCLISKYVICDLWNLERNMYVDKYTSMQMYCYWFEPIYTMRTQKRGERKVKEDVPPKKVPRLQKQSRTFDIIAVAEEQQKRIACRESWGKAFWCLVCGVQSVPSLDWCCWSMSRLWCCDGLG